MTVLMGLELLHPALSDWIMLCMVRFIQWVCLDVLVPMSLNVCGIMVDLTSFCLMRDFLVVFGLV